MDKIAKFRMADRFPLAMPKDAVPEVQVHTRRNKKADPFYLSTNWRNLRKLILGREPLCRICKGYGITTPARMVDHIKPIKDGGSNQFDNLQPLCYSCHVRKTAADRKAAVKGA